MCSRAALLLAIGVGASAARAGELAIAWEPSANTSVAGYRIYVGTEPGVYSRVIDAGSPSRARLANLDDEKLYYMTVKSYDATGAEIGVPAAELVSKPKPHLASIEPRTIESGRLTYVTLRGENLDENLQVRARDPRLVIRSFVQDGAGAATVGIEVAAGKDSKPVALEADSFTLINPGRKADEFFRMHPEVIDLDGDNQVGPADLARVRTAFGSQLGDRNFDAAADLDGDGTVDGRELTRVVARLGTSSTGAPLTR